MKVVHWSVCLSVAILEKNYRTDFVFVFEEIENYPRNQGLHFECLNELMLLLQLKGSSASVQLDSAWAEVYTLMMYFD